MNSPFFLWLAFVALKKKNYLLRHFLWLGSQHLAYLVQLLFILLVIIFGLPLAIVFKFHRFKSFFLSLFIWSYFTKNGRFFLLSTFGASANVGHSFLSFLMSLFVEGLYEFMLVVTSTSRTTVIVFLLFLLIVPVSTFPIIFGNDHFPICPTRPLNNLTDILPKPFLLHFK